MRTPKLKFGDPESIRLRDAARLEAAVREIEAGRIKRPASCPENEWPHLGACEPCGGRGKASAECPGDFCPGHEVECCVCGGKGTHRIEPVRADKEGNVTWCCSCGEEWTE